MRKNRIDNYDVPKDLKFFTNDILRVGGFKFFVKLKPADFQDTQNKSKLLDLSLKLEFTSNDTEIFANGKIKGLKEVECSRCLEKLNKKIDIKIDRDFSTKEQIIDIMKEIKSELALTNEISEVCKVNCKGLCVVCGNDLNKVKCKCENKPPSAFSVLKNKFKNIKKNFKEK